MARRTRTTGGAPHCAVRAPLERRTRRADGRSRCSSPSRAAIRWLRIVRASNGSSPTRCSPRNAFAEGRVRCVFAESLLATARREATTSVARSTPLRVPAPASDAHGRPTRSARRVAGARDPRGAAPADRDAWLAVAEEPTLSGGPRMRALADTLAVLATPARGAAHGSRTGAATRGTHASASVALGYTILAIADFRLA